MQRGLLTVFLLLIIIPMTALTVISCGSSDPIDEFGYRYQITYADVEDRGVSTTDIDIIQDCDGIYANGSDNEDPLTKTSMNITFKSETGESEIWVYKIEVSYSLIQYTDEYGAAVIPALPTSSFQRDILIPGNGGTKTESVDLLTTTDKEAYRELLGGDAYAIGVRAEFQVTVKAFMTATPRTPENHYETEYHFTINVQNFRDASCDSSSEEI